MTIRWIGDVAIISKERIEEVFKKKPSTKKILKKEGNTEGEYRVPKYRVVYGKGMTEIIHREEHCDLLFDINKVHFSFSLSGERKRIAQEVNDEENILCLFAGVGPFPIVITKKKKVRIVAVENNPDAFRYLLKNLEMNKLKGSVKALNIDAEELFENDHEEKNSFDRVIAPAPKIGKNFTYLLIDAIKKERKKKIYLYDFCRAEEIDFMKRLPWVVNVKKCGSYSPRVYRVCVEIDGGIYYESKNYSKLKLMGFHWL